MKRNLLILLVALVAVVLISVEMIGGNRLLAASPSGTSLALEVRPEAYIEASSVPVLTTAGDIQSLTIPLKVFVRLNDGTDGKLSITTRGIQTNESAEWSVETATGSKQVYQNPVMIRTFSRSGIYADSIVIQRNLASEAALPGSLEITLITSDGTAAWTHTVSVPSAQ